MFARLNCPILTLIVSLSCFAIAQLSTLAIAQESPSITRFAPDEVVFCLALTGEVKPNASGAGFERWLAQQEIKDSYLTIMEVIEEQIPQNDDTWAGMTSLIPQVVLGQPWIFYLEDANFDQPTFKFVLQLDALEDQVREKLTAIIQNENEDITEITVAGEIFQSLATGEGSNLEFGIYKNHLLVALGQGELAKLTERFSSAEPKWVGELQRELPVERTIGLLTIDIKQLVEQLPHDDNPALKLFKFDEIVRATGVMGFDGEETISRLSFHCPQPPTGIWKMFDVAPLAKEEYKGVADSIHSLTSFKFDPSVLWKLLLENPETQADVEEFEAMMQDMYGIDFEKDIVQNVGEHLYTYQQFSLLNPTANALFGLKIKNPEQFQTRLDEFVKAFEDNNDEFGIDIEETKNGPLYQLVPFDPNLQMFFPGVCFQMIDNELLVALDSKAITAHIRKAGREGGKLTDDPRMARLFDNQQNGGLGQPIAVFYLDVKVLIESLYSVLPILFGQFEQMGMDVDFDMEMLPSLETAVNRVLPDIISVYRTEKGFQVIERSTLPGISMSSGVAIALLLPAIQQARNAARRITSMNNLKQLALACHNFHDTHGAFPASHRTTKEGAKLLSWRVEMLPYIEQQELYEKFKHDEPWDSPHNRALIEEMPDVFKHPGLQNLEPGKTVYLGVTGKGSVFVPSSEKKGSTTIGNITDGTSNTLMIVEANEDHAVYWTQPNDFNIDEIEDLAAALKGNWPGDVFLGAMCDGSVHSFSTDDKRLRMMATIDGGEIDPMDDDE